MTTFICKFCGLTLDEGLIELQDVRHLKKTYGESMLPNGTYLISGGEFEPENEGDVLINVNALQNTRPYIEMPNRHNGCYGRDGCDGINEVCANGHEVATVRTDCWHASHVILSHKTVVAQAQQGVEADLP